MEELTKALAMDAEGVARAVGVTVRTVRAWLNGERQPAERNRIKLARLVTAAHQEHSSAGHRWSASRDKALCAAKLALMSADQRKLHLARQEQMRQQFTAPQQRHAVWASYRQPVAA